MKIFNKIVEKTFMQLYVFYFCLTLVFLLAGFIVSLNLTNLYVKDEAQIHQFIQEVLQNDQENIRDITNLSSSEMSSSKTSAHLLFSLKTYAPFLPVFISFFMICGLIVSGLKKGVSLKLSFIEAFCQKALTKGHFVMRPHFLIDVPPHGILAEMNRMIFGLQTQFIALIGWTKELAFLDINAALKARAESIQDYITTSYHFAEDDHKKGDALLVQYQNTQNLVLFFLLPFVESFLYAYKPLFYAESIPLNILSFLLVASGLFVCFFVYYFAYYKRFFLTSFCAFLIGVSLILKLLLSLALPALLIDKIYYLSHFTVFATLLLILMMYFNLKNFGRYLIFGVLGGGIGYYVGFLLYLKGFAPFFLILSVVLYSYFIFLLPFFNRQKGKI